MLASTASFQHVNNVLNGQESLKSAVAEIERTPSVSCIEPLKGISLAIDMASVAPSKLDSQLGSSRPGGGCQFSNPTDRKVG
jgi:hypothetical protein